MELLRPCIRCGEPGTATRCQECQKSYGPQRHKPKKPFNQRGYDAAFVRLSKKARRLQPWCLDCQHTGSPDNPLTCEHLPGSWEKRARGERLTLSDVAVLCRSCNSSRGPQRKQITN